MGNVSSPEFWDVSRQPGGQADLPAEDFIVPSGEEGSELIPWLWRNNYEFLLSKIWETKKRKLQSVLIETNFIFSI